MEEKDSIKVHFIHPTEGKMITVDMWKSITPSEIIDELLAVEFIPNCCTYSLAIKGGSLLKNGTPVFKSDLRNGDTIRILPNVNAG